MTFFVDEKHLLIIDSTIPSIRTFVDVYELWYCPKASIKVSKFELFNIPISFSPMFYL